MDFRGTFDFIIVGGSVGLLAALILRDKGVSEIHLAETNALRRATAEDAFGDDDGGGNGVTVFNPIDAPSAPDNFDAVFDAVGNAQTRAAAVQSARAGAVIMHIGLADAAGDLDVRRLTLQEITFIGCYTYTPTDLATTLAKLHAGALGNLNWIAQRPLADGAAAFNELLAGECAAAKVVLRV